jgi:hypothetical protein
MKAKCSTATPGWISKTPKNVGLKSKLSFTRDRSALAEPIENLLLSSMKAFTDKLVDYADAIEDRVVHVVTSSAESVNQGYRLWNSRDALTDAALIDLVVTIFKILLVGALTVSSFIVFQSSESMAYLLFAFGAAAVAVNVSVHVLLDTPHLLMDLCGRLMGQPSQRMQIFCADVTYRTAILTERGVIYASYNAVPKPIFVQWRDIGSARLIGGSDIVLNDLDGKQAVRLNAPATNTMTHEDVLEFIREQINLTHIERLKETNQAL